MAKDKKDELKLCEDALKAIGEAKASLAKAESIALKVVQLQDSKLQDSKNLYVSDSDVEDDIHSTPCIH